MDFNSELIAEMNMLIKFSLSSEMTGLKVHSSASGEVIAATERLFAKGLVTAKDGGYLTNLGRDAAIKAKEVLQILTY